MNQEIAEFFIQFTTKGFEGVSDKIDDLSKKMDEVGKASEKATEKHKGFFSNIGGWIASLGLITTAVWALKSAWDGVAEVSAKTMELQWSSLYVGTSSETLERWQNVARRKRGEAAMGDIVPSFNALYKFLYNFTNAQFQESFNEKIGLALQGTNGAADIQDALVRSAKQGNANALLQVLNGYFSSGVLGSQAKQSILEAFGLNNETMLGLLSFKTLPQMLADVPTHKSKEENVINSAKYTEARAKLKEATEEFWFAIQPEITRLIQWFTNNALPVIREFLYTYWPQIETGIKSIFNWIMEKLGLILDKFGDEKAKAGFWDKVKGAVIVGSTEAGIGALGGGVAGGPWGAALGAGAGFVGGAITGWKAAEYAGGEVQFAETRKARENAEWWASLTEAQQWALYNSGADYYLDNGIQRTIPRAMMAYKEALNANANATANITVNGRTVASADGSYAVADFNLKPDYAY